MSDPGLKRTLALTALAAAVLVWPRLDAQQQAPGQSSPAALARARTSGLEHLRVVGEQKGIAPNDLVVSRVDVDRGLMAHARVQQYLRGVPVFGGEAIAHLNPDGSVFGETDDLVADVKIDPTPRLTAADAIQIATNDYGCSQCLTAPPTADLWILRDEAGLDHLVFRVQMRRIDGSARTAMPVRFVDAHGGYVVRAYDNLHTGTGDSLYSGMVPIGTRFNPMFVDYAMQNHTLRVGTFDMMNTENTYSAFIDLDDIWDAFLQRPAVDAHYAMEKFYGYLSLVHGRNGIDGSGGPFTAPGDDPAGTLLVGSFVHYGVEYNGAFWDGSGMVYGDGDGVAFLPAVTLDIAGHEMTHGVTQFTADLVYSGESGALNESWSDVFGAMLERYVRGEDADTWRIAEEAYTPGTPGDALRHMDDPHQAAESGFTGDDDPDHYSERYTGVQDNGGVHINSGIANKAFYLLAKGGSHHLGGSMTGIGADDAAKIWFTALTSYMTSSTNFLGARNATMLAAAALHGPGSAQEQAVATAWCLVGVGVCSGVQAISVTPNSGAGVTQVFTATYSNPGGASNLKARIRFAVGNVAPGSCTVEYNAKSHSVRMMDDAGAWGMDAALGSGTLANSQCTLNLALSSAVENGVNLTLSLHLTFSPPFTGLKDIYLWARQAGGTKTGWVPRGTWTAGVLVEALSLAPNAGSGMSQLFTAVYSDTEGASDLRAMIRFGTGNVGTCVIEYNAATDLIRMRDNAGVWGPKVPLGVGTLANGQCTVDLVLSSAAETGDTLTLSLHIGFDASFAGLKNVSIRAKSVLSATADTKFVQQGSWNIPSAMPTVTIVATDPTASEAGPDTGLFTFTRTGNPSLALNNVTFTRTGTASAGADYGNFALSVNFPAAQAAVTVTVTPVSDALVEGNETVILTLTDGPDYDLGSPSQATVTIADQVMPVIPVITIAATDPAASEVGPDPGTFTFTRSGSVTQALNGVTYSRTGTATPGVDYTPNLGGGGVVSFAAGSATTTVVITPLADMSAESSETVILTVTDGLDWDVGSPAAATVTIADQGPATLGGTWLGGTGQSQLFKTWVDSNGVVGITTFIVGSGAGVCPVPVGISLNLLPAAPIAGGNFSVNFTAGQTGWTGTVAGSFTNSTSAAGTIDATFNGPAACTPIQTTWSATHVDNGPIPVVSVVAADPDGSEVSSDNGTFTITRAGSLAEDVFVQYLMTGSATGGTDYVSLSFGVTIPAGQSAVTLTVDPINDALVEGAETAVLTLNDLPAYLLGAPVSATVTIADNPVPIVSIVATDPNAFEATSDSGTMTVSRVGNTSLPLAVTYLTSGSAGLTDYVNFFSPVIIPAGQTSVVLTVTPNQDFQPEPSETVIVTLTPGQYQIGSPGAATVTIADSDSTVTVIATDPNASEVGLDPGTFTFTRTGPTTGPLTVSFTTGGTATLGVDYVNVGWTSVTIPAGAASATKTVTPIADGLVDGSKTVVVTLALGNHSYIIGTPATATVTIADQPTPIVTIVATDPSAAEAGLDPGTFTITRTGDTTAPLTVSYTIGGNASHGTDYEFIFSPVTIPAGQASVTRTVLPKQDPTVESPETVILTLTDGAHYDLGPPATQTATVTITSDE